MGHLGGIYLGVGLANVLIIRPKDESDKLIADY